MENQEAATWRQWTNLLARVRFGSQKVAGRTLSGTLIKAVLERVATYGDGDGTRVHPGIARIAIDLETSYTTVRNAITIGERVGLLRCVRAGNRGVGAAEYELIIGEQLMESVELWTPSRYGLEIRRYAEKYLGKHRRLTPQESVEGEGGLDRLTLLESVVSDRLTPQESVEARVDQPSTDTSGVSVPPTTDTCGTPRLTPQESATNQYQSQVLPTNAERDLRTNLTSPRARARQDPKPSSSPVDLVDRPRCPHGRSPRRDAGTPRCPDCRAETTPAAVDIGPAHCPTHGKAFAAGLDTHGVPRCTLCRHQPKERHA